MPYRKRTAIWTDTDWRPARPLCRYDCAASSLEGRKHHTSHAQRGKSNSGDSAFALNALYAIPAELCDELAGWATRNVAGH